MVSRLFSPVRLALAVAAAVVVVLAVATSPAAACSCALPPPYAKAVAKAVYAVRAKVTKAVFIPDPIEQQDKRAEWAARVITAYKGCLPRTIAITSGANSALCGISLTVGTEYVFLLRSSDFDGKFRVNSCDTTKTWADVTVADRRVLRRANDQVCPSRRWYTKG